MHFIFRNILPQWLTRAANQAGNDVRTIWEKDMKRSAKLIEICDSLNGWSGVSVVRTVRKWAADDSWVFKEGVEVLSEEDSYFIALEMWRLGSSVVRKGVTDKGVARLLANGHCYFVECVFVVVLKDIRIWIDLKDGGCQWVNGFCMSLFPCCKALWENVSNYVVSLPTFVVSNQIYFNLHNFEVFPTLYFLQYSYPEFLAKDHSIGILARFGQPAWSANIIALFILYRLLSSDMWSFLLGRSFNSIKCLTWGLEHSEESDWLIWKANNWTHFEKGTEVHGSGCSFPSGPSVKGFCLCSSIFYFYDFS